MICKKCGKEMVRKTGVSGHTGEDYDFWGCKGYPKCKHKETPEGVVWPTPSPDAPNCPVCGKQMCRRKGPNGMFYGCSGYPDCKKTIDIKVGYYEYIDS